MTFEVLPDRADRGGLFFTTIIWLRQIQATDNRWTKTGEMTIVSYRGSRLLKRLSPPKDREGPEKRPLKFNFLLFYPTLFTRAFPLLIVLS